MGQLIDHGSRSEVQQQHPKLLWDGCAHTVDEGSKAEGAVSGPERTIRCEGFTADLSRRDVVLP